VLAPPAKRGRLVSDDSEGHQDAILARVGPFVCQLLTGETCDPFVGLVLGHFGFAEINVNIAEAIRITGGQGGCRLRGHAADQGFDARQSGSWFDPATAGQGLQMTIIPPGNGSSGLVFAAWFTFDPAGQSDDPIHQHWFTLQGDLSTATEGKVTLPIYRIIGGPFDGAPTQNFTQVGHATLTMQGCDSAQFQYQFDATEVAHAFAGLAGTSHLAKIGGCNAP